MSKGGRPRIGSDIICEFCSKSFYVPACRVRNDEKEGKKVRFCSMLCYNKSGVRVPPTMTPEAKSKMLAHPNRQRFKRGPDNPNMKRFGNWFGYKTASKYMRENFFRCQMCGWDKKPEILQIHHLDGNRLNNVLENIRLICPNCHSSIHYDQRDGHYHLLNKGQAWRQQPRKYA